MRVISGYLKGKKLLGYNVSTTRPTMDRVKESLFASIQNHVEDSICLDLFCGTGSLGIEALSMNAKECYFVDNNKDILFYLNKNIDSLKIRDKARVLPYDYKKALKYFKENNIKFDLILVDAPYKMKVASEVINLVTSYNLLNKNGFLVLEYSYDLLKDNYDSLSLYKNKKYGDKYISIYTKVID